jgi:putative membrane protein
MRQKRPWEAFLNHKTNREWASKIQIPEFIYSLDEELKSLLSESDYEYVVSKSNKSTALLSLQSKFLSELKEKGIIWELVCLGRHPFYCHCFLGVPHHAVYRDSRRESF